MQSIFSGLKLSGGNQAQALTGAAAKLTPFSTNGANASKSQWGIDQEGGQDIVPVLASDQLNLAAPGIYLVMAQICGVGALAADLTFQAALQAVLQTEIGDEVHSIMAPYTLSAALTPAAVAQGTTAEQSFTGFGNTATDIPVGFAIKPTNQAGLGITGTRIIDATHVGISFCNVPNAGGNITPTGGETYQLTVLRPGRWNAKLFGILNVPRNVGDPGTKRLEIWAKSSVNQNITVEFCNLLAQRLE